MKFQYHTASITKIRIDHPTTNGSKLPTISRKDAAEYYKGVEKETVRCPVCDSDQHRTLFDRDRFGMRAQTAGCMKCGLIFINPRPIPEEMDRFYRDHYRSFYESIEKPDVDYISQGPFRARAKFVIQMLAPYQGRFQSILDIGCSEGCLLKELVATFPESSCFGVEPDPNFAEFARQYTGAKQITNSSFDHFVGQCDQTFDLITLTHVLEHLLFPLKDLKSIHRLLSDDGIFYVEVPNLANPESIGIRHIHLGHVVSFSPQSLRIILDRAGFKVIGLQDEGLAAVTPSMAAICEKSHHAKMIQRRKLLSFLAPVPSKNFLPTTKTGAARQPKTERREKPRAPCLVARQPEPEWNSDCALLGGGATPWPKRTKAKKNQGNRTEH